MTAREVGASIVVGILLGLVVVAIIATVVGGLMLLFSGSKP
jgi:hypothetical protein